MINKNNVVFDQDTAGCHIRLVTCQKLSQLLFWSLQNLSDLYFTWGGQKSPEKVFFFVSKKQKIYDSGVMLLPGRWQKWFDQNEPYLYNLMKYLFTISKIISHFHKRQRNHFPKNNIWNTCLITDRIDLFILTPKSKVSSYTISIF